MRILRHGTAEKHLGLFDGITRGGKYWGRVVIGNAQGVRGLDDVPPWLPWAGERRRTPGGLSRGGGWIPRQRRSVLGVYDGEFGDGRHSDEKLKGKAKTGCPNGAES